MLLIDRKHRLELTKRRLRNVESVLTIKDYCENSERCGPSIYSLIDKQRKKEVGALDKRGDWDGKFVRVRWKACLGPVLDR